MSKIIKNNNADEATRSFFEEDVFYPRMQNKEKKIAAAQKEAYQIVQDAEAQAGAIIEKFQAEGIRQGVEETQPLSGLLQSLITEMGNYKRQAVSELEPLVVDLALTIAKKIVKTELKTNTELIKTTVMSALRSIINKRHVVLYVNPHDKALLEKHKNDLLMSFREIEDFVIEENPSLSRGGCYIKTDCGELDATLETQLRQMGVAFNRDVSLVD